MKRLRIACVPLALLAMAALAAPVQAQGTDFSGTWRLDAGASEFPDFQGRGGGGRRGGGGGPRGGRGGGAAATLVIVQTAEMLIVEQQSDRGSRAITYRLNGDESTNPGPGGAQTTRTRWDGAALVTEGTMEMSTPRGDFSMGLTERRTLSDDGQTLTVASTRSTPRGDVNLNLVYRRGGA